jgi:hypothetical protein
VLELNDGIAELDRLIKPLVAELAPTCCAWKVSASRTPASSWSLPATTPSGCARRPASPIAT